MSEENMIEMAVENYAYCESQKLRYVTGEAGE